jgi:Cu/Ag efflux protein CusF
MSFPVRDKAQLQQLKPGQQVEVEFEQGKDQQFVITRIAPLATGTAPAEEAAHKGH